MKSQPSDGYRPPDFKGLRVLSAPQYPSRSTQMQIGGGQTFVQNGYTWQYALMVPPGAKGPFTFYDDGEKLGVWPKTWETAWGKERWVARFLDSFPSARMRSRIASSGGACSNTLFYRAVGCEKRTG